MPAKTDRFSVRLEPEDSAMLQQLARALGHTTSDILRGLIREAYKKRLATMQTRSGFGFALGGLTRPRPPPKKKAPKRRP